MSILDIMTRHQSENTRTKRERFLLICGPLSSLLYVVATILGAMVWEGYNALSQTVSELFAIDAPSRSLVIPLFLVYDALMIAFVVSRPGQPTGGGYADPRGSSSRYEKPAAPARLDRL